MIAPMAKIQIAALAQDREALLQFLQEEEVVHIAQAPIDLPRDIKGGESRTPYRLARMQFVLEFIQRIKKELHLEEKKSFKNIFINKPAAILADLEDVLQKLDVDTLISRTEQLNDAMVETEARIHALTQEHAQLEPWAALELRGEDLTINQPVTHTLLEIVIRDQEAFNAALAEIPTGMWQEVRQDNTGKAPVVWGELVTHADDTDALRGFLQRVAAREVDVNLEDRQSIADKLRDIKEEIKAQNERYKEVLEKAKGLTKSERDVQFAYDALLHKQEREAVEHNVIQSPFSALLTGWVPESFLPILQKRLSAQFPSAAVETIAVDEQDKPPVSLRNSKLIQPFEAVTNIYGKPGYAEIDPTGSLSLFFLIAFGLALTDAGYGILLMVGTFAAERFFKLKKELRKMIRLMFYAGFFTFFLGALAGGWFGVELEKLPESGLKSALLSVKIIDPVQEPLKLLGVAFALGIIQLLFAWVVRAQVNWRDGNKLNILLDDIPWITMVVFILAWAGANVGVAGLADFVEPLKWAAITNAIVLTLTQGRSYKNPLVKVGAGAISLYGLISFMSDTLSYSRLLALGLATGIIGLVVNLIASMVSSSIPVLGLVLAGVVLVIGHAFNLGINALGAFIHSGRLQFVEFFPKFLEGGGVPYRPLGRVSKYVDNPKEYD